MDAARKVLEHDHFGLEKVKERILETIAVRQMNPDVKGQILCLVGPPGVGKTSISAAFVRLLTEAYPDKHILAIDADPAVGLSTALGVEVKETLDALRGMGLWALRLQFTTENPGEIDKVLMDYQGRAVFDAGSYTRGLYSRGVE